MTSTLLGRVLRVTAAPIIRGLFRTRVIGRENIPATAAILSGNHASYAEPVLLWCVTPRPVHEMGKAELWDVPLLRWALPRAWGFPVKRGTADREALGTASTLLRAGHLVAVFPEGTRNQEGLGEGHGGAAFLAVRNDAPVVPVGFAGTERILPKGSRMMRFPRVTVVFGEAIDPGDYVEGTRKERIAYMTDEIMSRIAAAVERARQP